VLFDLLVGDGSVRPTAADGYAASEAASDGPIATGRVGAGTGATYAKWRGREFRKPGGLGTATVRDGDVIVSALVAVNALGERRPAASGTPVPAPFMENTTIGVVATNAKLTKLQCHLLAQSAHDGLARALEPAHSAGDGDAFVVLATAAVDADLPLEPIRIRAAQAVEHAIAKVTSEA
jgi:L-aminopeptidase/D-esterase-like protein